MILNFGLGQLKRNLWVLTMLPCFEGLELKSKIIIFLYVFVINFDQKALLNLNFNL
jgi:hypothetical protein